MIELVINTPFSTVISGPNGIALTDQALFLGSSASGLPVTVSQVGSTNVWTVSFTPAATGLYSLYAFGEIKLQVQCLSKTLSSSLRDIEDEALGSWSWDKTTNILTMYRQNGSVLATHTIVDNTTVSSRERN